MFSPPYCAPLLSRPEPRALRVHGRWEVPDHSVSILLPHPPLTLGEALPPGLGSFPLLMLRTGLPEAGDNLPREDQTNPPRDMNLDGFQSQATASSSSMREKTRIERTISLWTTSHLYRAHVDGLLGSPLLATAHILLEKGGVLPILSVPPPERDVE